jgi:hypothetical protein
MVQILATAYSIPHMLLPYRTLTKLLTLVSFRVGIFQNPVTSNVLTDIGLFNIQLIMLDTVHLSLIRSNWGEEAIRIKR